MAVKQAKSLDYASRIAKFELDVALDSYIGINTAVSLSCYILAKYKEYDQLVSKRIDPIMYNDANKFADDYLAVTLLSKSKNLPTSFDKEKAAWDGYKESELRCAETNDILIKYRDGLLEPIDSRINNVITDAQKYVTRILGKVTKRTLEKIDEDMSFGPGATVGVKRVVTSGRKYDNPIIDCTTEVLGFGIHCLPPMWKARVVGFNPVDSADLEFVPKNSKTYRSIEIQPSLNIYIQKGIGSVVRKRLAAFGLDLGTQEHNQKGAQHASLHGDSWTIDLKSASDTVAHQAVRLLFSKSTDWLNLLEWSRVGKCKTKSGEIISLEKFSAMGNGYTFELETLIFYAICKACDDICKGEVPVLVYGDDIIVGNSSAKLVLDTLKFLGFSVNTEKTFGKTYFRESCGADFFNGINVRPFLFKKEGKTFDDFNEICYTYANLILHYNRRRYGGGFRDDRFLRAWLRCFTTVPKRLRYRVSPDFASGGFLGSFDECVPQLQRASRGWQGYFFKYSYRPIRRTDRYVIGALTSALHRGSEFSNGFEALRGNRNILAATTKTGYSLEWPDFGPWITI